MLIEENFAIGIEAVAISTEPDELCLTGAGGVRHVFHGVGMEVSHRVAVVAARCGLGPMAGAVDATAAALAEASKAAPWSSLLDEVQGLSLADAARGVGIVQVADCLALPLHRPCHVRCPR